MADYNPDHKAVLDKLLLGYPDVRAGRMFGYPAYYVGRRLSACLYQEGVGIKLPAGTVTRLLDEDPNAIPFQPLGRPKMREWVQINLNHSQDYHAYLPLFEESIRFLLDGTGRA